MSSIPSGAAARKSTGIARATAIMMATVLLSRVLGVLRDAIISHYFGRGPETDAYNAAFTVPDLLFYLLQSGALSSTIVPIITEYRAQGREDLADKTINIVATTIFVFIGSLILLMEVNARSLTLFLNPGFIQKSNAGYIIPLAVHLTRILLPAQICFFLGGLMSGVLYSRKQFLAPALAPVIYNSGIIFGGLVLRHWLGLQGLIWGAVGGAFFGNLLLPAFFVYRDGLSFRPSLDVLHPAARKVWRMLLPIGLGVALPNIDQIVNKAFASCLGPGDITATMNAYRLMLLPIGVFAQAMSLAVYPTLSHQAADKDMPAMRKTMGDSLCSIFFLTAPAAALMFILSVPTVSFLLQSGHFSHNDSVVTAAALQYFALGICAWSAQSLLTRGFYALQNSRIPVVSGALVSILFVAMNYGVIHATHWGVPGLAAATSLAATIHMTALFFLLHWRLGGLDLRVIMVNVARTLLATTALCAVAYPVRCALDSLLPHLGVKLHAIIVLGAGSAAGLSAFLAVAVLLRMPELRSAIRLVRRTK